MLQYFPVSFLIPTHNRNKSLTETVKSIRELTEGVQVQVIIADNSSVDYEENPFSKGKNIPSTWDFSFLDFRGQSMIDTFEGLIFQANRPYSIIVEDDDVLISHYYHQHYIENSLLPSGDSSLCGVLAFKTLRFSKEYNIFTSEPLYFPSEYDFNHINPCSGEGSFLLFPEIWKGTFQFGQAYINTILLQRAFQAWFYLPSGEIDYSKNFDISNDEILMLHVLADPEFTHVEYCPFAGLHVGINDDNLSWKNPVYQMLSGRHYFADKLNHLLTGTEKEKMNWNESMKEIYLRENLKDCPAYVCLRKNLEDPYWFEVAQYIKDSLPVLGQEGTVAYLNILMQSAFEKLKYGHSLSEGVGS